MLECGLSSSFSALSTTVRYDASSVPGFVIQHSISLVLVLGSLQIGYWCPSYPYLQPLRLQTALCTVVAIGG